MKRRVGLDRAGLWGLVLFAAIISGGQGDDAPVIQAGNVTSRTPLPTGFNPQLTAPTLAGGQVTANPGSCFPEITTSAADLAIRRAMEQAPSFVNSIMGPSQSGLPANLGFDATTACGPERFPLNADCGGFPEGSQTVPECDALKDRATGGLSQSQISGAVDRFLKGRSSACCQASKFATGAQRLTCLNTAMQTVATELGRLQAGYQSKQAEFNRAFTAAKAAQDDIDSRNTEIDRRLTDGEDSLTKTRDAVQSALDGLQGSGGSSGFADGVYTATGSSGTLGGSGTAAEAAQEIAEQIQRDKTAFPILVQQTQMQYTRECVATLRSTGYRCPGNPSPVSFTEFLSCLGAQQNRYEKGGTVCSTTRCLEKEKNTKANLDSLFGRIMNDLPGGTGSATPSAAGGTSKEDAAAAVAANNASALTSPTAVLEKYGSELRAYNLRGVDIAAQFQQALGSCHQRMGERVQREMTQPGRPLAQERARITQNETRLNNRLSQELNKSGRLLERVNRALTQGHTATPLANCTNADTAGRISCLRQATTLLRGKLNGETEAPQSIPIPGRTRNLALNVSCKGLDGCIREMGNMKTQLTTQKTQIGALMESQKQAFNQGLQAALAQTGTELRDRLAPMQSRVTELQGLMGQMGVSFEINSYEPKQLEPDANGIMQTPTDLVAFLGGQGTPPMPDYRRGGLQGAISSIGTKRTEMSAKVATFDGLLTQLMEKASSCRAEFITAAAADLRSKATALASACGTQINYCSANGDRVRNLVRDVRSALQEAEISGSSRDAETDGATDGMSQLCNDSRMRPARCTEALLNQSGDDQYFPCPPAPAACGPDARRHIEGRGSRPAACEGVTLRDTLAATTGSNTGQSPSDADMTDCASKTTAVDASRRRLNQVRGGDGTSRRIQ